jgi:O-antigen/teichoic acid export membrane protein
MKSNQVKQGEDAKKTAGNISSAFLMRAARYPFLLLFIFIIPRMLGASDYGKYAFIVSILMLASELCTFGITVVFGRYIPELLIRNEQKKLQQLVSFYLTIWMFCCTLLAAVAVILYFTINMQGKEVPVFIIVYLALVSEILSLILYALLYGLNYVGKSNAINLFRSVFRLAFLLIFYPILGFYGALISLLLTSIVSILYAIFSIKKVFDFKFQKPVFKEFLPQLKFGIIIFLPTLLFLFQQQIGPVFLKTFSFSNKEIGYFDLANQGFLVLYGLAITSFEALIPISSKFEIIGQAEKSIDWLFMLLRYILPILLIIVSFFYLFGNEVIMLILGQEYISIYTIALIILLSIPIWVMGQLGYVRSISLSKAKPYLRSTIFSTIIFVTFGIFSVKSLGAIGLASAIVLSAATFSVSILFSYKEFIPRLVIIIWKILLSLISFSFMFLWNFQVIELKIIVFLCSAALFLTILFKLKIINLHELKQLITALRKKSPKDEISAYSQKAEEIY